LNFKEWLLTNGMGSFAIGSSTGLCYRPEHILFTALLRPPMRRMALVRRLVDVVLLNNEWYDFSPDPKSLKKNADSLLSFQLKNNMPFYQLQTDEFTLNKSIWMDLKSHSLCIKYEAVSAAEPVRLRLTPHLMLPESFFQIASIMSAFRPDPSGFSFKIETKGDSWLHFSLMSEAYVTLINSWRSLLFEDGEKETNYLPAAVNFALGAGESTVLRIGIRRDNQFDAEESYKCASIRNSQKSVLNETLLEHAVEPYGKHGWMDFIVQHATSQKLKNTSIFAGFPNRMYNGWTTSLALPGLLLTIKEFAKAKDALFMLRENTKRGQIPAAFPENIADPAYDSLDATLWYFVANYEYWESSGDLLFIEKQFSFLLEILSAYIDGLVSGVAMDEDDGLLVGATGKLSWMNRKAGEWLITPRLGKAIEVQALWYNALCIMHKFSLLMGKTAGLGKIEMLENLVKESLNQQFWLPEAGCFADVLEEEYTDTTFRPNQVIAIGLPFMPVPKSSARLVLEKVNQFLLTPYGLRTLSPTHPAYCGATTQSTLERAGSWHNGAIHPWLAWPYVRASLRVGYDRSELAEKLAPLLALVHHGLLGHISEAYEGDYPHKPMGDPACAHSLGAVMQCQSALFDA